MPKLLKPGQLASILRPGTRVFVQSSSSEPSALVQELFADPEAAAGIEFISCQIPGLNRVDFASLHPDARFTGLFVTPEIEVSYRQEKVRFMPLSYSGMYRYLESEPIDVAMIQVAPTGKQGIFSLGSSVHFVPAILKRAKIVIAEINEDLPTVGRSISIDETRLDYVLPTAHPLLVLPLSQPTDVMSRIGAHIAELVRDGDQVQVGIGRVPNAVLGALEHHRRLSFQGGLISDAMIDLWDKSAIDSASPLVCTSVIGTKRLYDWVRDRQQISVHPVGYSHDVRVLSERERFVAINSVLSVDLDGQANAETVDGRQAGGCGGLADFVRGARLSDGGRSILALPSTAVRGTISRIVPTLTDDIASCSRVDADYIVTEHGVAALRHKSLDERAEALIQIADPSFRDMLSKSREVRPGRKPEGPRK